MWFISLVFKYHLIKGPVWFSLAFPLTISLNLRSLLAKYPKRVRLLCSPRLYIPFGWSKPSLVPCPPLIMHTATSLNKQKILFSNGHISELIKSFSKLFTILKSKDVWEWSKFYLGVFFEGWSFLIGMLV